MYLGYISVYISLYISVTLAYVSQVRPDQPGSWLEVVGSLETRSR